MQQFIDADRGYLDWIPNNPTGFVVNSYRKPSRVYLRLHRATCWTISTPRRSNWTMTDYIKTCSLNKTELENWAQSEVGGNLNPCEKCKP